jgi:hypothetical protein
VSFALSFHSDEDEILHKQIWTVRKALRMDSSAEAMLFRSNRLMKVLGLAGCKSLLSNNARTIPALLRVSDLNFASE